MTDTVLEVSTTTFTIPASFCDRLFYSTSWFTLSSSFPAPFRGRFTCRSPFDLPFSSFALPYRSILEYHIHRVESCVLYWTHICNKTVSHTLKSPSLNPWNLFRTRICPVTIFVLAPRLELNFSAARKISFPYPSSPSFHFCSTNKNISSYPRDIR